MFRAASSLGTFNMGSPLSILRAPTAAPKVPQVTVIHPTPTPPLTPASKSETQTLEDIHCLLSQDQQQHISSESLIDNTQLYTLQKGPHFVGSS